MFRDAGGSVWNQVDTVVDQATCVETLEQLGGSLDVALCGYKPLLEHATMWREEVAFPQARYDRLLEAALGSRAGWLVPSSAGLAFSGDNTWMNSICYPVSREQFAADIAAVAPDRRCVILSPGQTLVVEGGDVKVEPSDYAETLDADTRAVHFDPDSVTPPPLRDPNPRRTSERALHSTLDALITQKLAARMTERLADPMPGVLNTLFCRRARLQIDMVLPSRTASWHTTAWTPRVQLAAGADDDPDYVFTYIGSQIVAALEGAPYTDPEVYARRRRTPPDPDAPFRFSALDPARLNGIDPYGTVDETYEWSPLELLEE